MLNIVQKFHILVKSNRSECKYLPKIYTRISLKDKLKSIKILSVYSSKHQFELGSTK